MLYTCFIKFYFIIIYFLLLQVHVYKFLSYLRKNIIFPNMQQLCKNWPRDVFG